jgi:26S proteasome regulatory subunit N1
MKKQLAYFLARSQVPISWVHATEGAETEGVELPEQPEDLLECLGNVKLSTHFRNFGKAVGVEDPRTPEDIYKTHLEPTRTTVQADSARHNLASTFVNAFVNAGFGNDKLMVNAPEGASWIYKNKEHGMMSATASIGMSMIWDSEAGIDHIDKYSYSSEEHIKAGAFLAMGILHSGIRTDPDVAFALLEEHVDSKSVPLKVAAINGIAIAYAGSQRRDIAEKLLPHVADETNTMEVAAMAALALGFVFVGSGDGEIASTILQTLMEREHAQLDSEWTVFMALALGLLFLGKYDTACNGKGKLANAPGRNAGGIGRGNRNPPRDRASLGRDRDSSRGCVQFRRDGQRAQGPGHAAYLLGTRGLAKEGGAERGCGRRGRGSTGEGRCSGSWSRSRWRCGRCGRLSAGRSGW